MTAPARSIPAQDRFAVEGLEVLATGDPLKPGTFKITAYTGAPVQRWYGPMVIDVAGVECPEKLAILTDHDSAKRTGYATKITKDGGAIKLEGTILDNPHGTSFANDSAAGFPFQASVGIEFLRVEDLKAGDEKKVNGRTIRGPATIATKSRLRETSVLACGADHNTSAEAFSRDPATGTIEVTHDKEQTAMSTPEEIKAAVEASKKADAERLATIKAALGPDRAALTLARVGGLLESQAAPSAAAS